MDPEILQEPEPPVYLVTLFLALEQMEAKAQDSRAKEIAKVDLEKLIAWISLYVR